MSYQTDAQQNKLLAIVAYIPILFLIPLFVAKDSAFARYHANQGILVTIIWAAGLVVASILPGFLSGLFSTVWMLALIACFIIGLLNVLRGETNPLPFIGETKIIK
ncbi:hypothetical protein [Alkalicoccobacillus porphyridii]|uniref:DUF4870 domain-containing protein n=1 Tax=Alkalicoccobacillus porphyridii TaxID=2597270 RepID=A0A553ZVI7_9BACI|nr:hypothetical protein [Alkalicoccobacillus porphyridii]TSB45498.1 hypothetical protein FN960_16340 [Alkalicoccobacillus porphyridii]